jgi:xylulokinase
MTPTSDQVTVGIDIGTTATKAVAVDGGGSVLARSRVRHEVFTPEPDLLEHDAGQAWRRGPTKALAELRTAVSGRPLAGVCVAGMVPSLTAVGARGVPCAPGLLYGDRRESRARPEESAEGEGVPPGAPEASDNAITGIPDAQGFMRFLVREFPGARGYWPAQAVADYGLSGIPAIDTALSMSLGGLMSFGQWDEQLLEHIGVTKKQLPVIVPMGEAAGEVKGTSAVLAGGTVDALCDQIVSGAEQPGDVLVICGATLVVWAVVSDWIEAPGLLTVPHTVGGRVLVGGPSNAGALFVDWARALLDGGLRGSGAASAARGRVEGPPEPASLDPWSVPVWTPYVRGERVPFHDPFLRSALYGLDITHRAPSLERAAYEASGFVVRRMLDLAGIRARRIVASGGGTRVSGWMQAIADTTDLPVDVVAVHEGAALGAAYLARMAAGMADGLEGSSSWARVGDRIEPDGRWKEAVDERYARFVSVGPGV